MWVNGCHLINRLLAKLPTDQPSHYKLLFADRLLQFADWSTANCPLIRTFVAVMKYVLYALLAWFLYKLIFRFIIPIVITTRRMKKKFREMHARMEEQQKDQQNFSPPSSHQKPSSPTRNEDYIDFEEVK